MKISEKQFLIAITISLLLASCGQTSIESKRKKTMTEIINALLSNDTLKLYSLIDTTLMSQMESHKAVSSMIYNLHNTLSKESVEFHNNYLQATDKTLNSTTYTISLPLLKDKIFDSVMLIFKFNDPMYKTVYDFTPMWHRIRKIDGTIKAPDFHKSI